MKNYISLTVLFLLLTSPQYGLAKTWYQVPTATGWAVVDSLLVQGKNDSACDSLQVILNRAVLEKEEKDWANSLIRMVQIRLAMHQDEKATLLMHETPWPRSSSLRAPLNLYFGLCLDNYLQRYRHEVNQREKLIGAIGTGPKSWSVRQFDQKINSIYQETFTIDYQTIDNGCGALEPWLEGNTYPTRIQGTARDAVAYIWVKHLRNTAFWLPHHHEEKKEFLAAEFFSEVPSPDVDLSSPDIHPLIKIKQILRELRQNHLKEGRIEAALEAELQLMAILDVSLSDANRHEVILREITRLLENTDPDLPWWSKGMWNLGGVQKAMTGPENNIRALECYQKGARRHPESRGGQMCLASLEDLQRPDYTIEAMTVDGPGKRSIQIKHRNLARVYFRAWKLDLESQVEGFDQSRRVPYTPEAVDDSLVFKADPDMVWSQVVPDPMDYHYHNSYAPLPHGQPGAYLVVTSLWEDFRELQNNQTSFYTISSDLVLSAQESSDGVHFELCSGETGDPRPGVGLKVWTSSKRKGPKNLVEFVTDEQGQAFLPQGKFRYYRAFAKQGEDVAFLEPASYRPSTRPRQQTDSFIYTDRSIYRPGQNLQFKIVAYESEVPNRKFRTLASQPVSITLHDSQGKAVSTLDVVTNDFGSASGSFEIPHGLVLGQWRLTDSLGGRQTIRVEEYKRPTFEVTLNTPEHETHLGDMVRISGKAEYYFGQPVGAGKVEWKISRDATMPRYWWRSWHPQQTKKLAEGSGTLEQDGTFAIEFPATAEEGMEQYGIRSYSFRLTVKVINDGGETITENLKFHVGLSAVTASVNPLKKLVFKGEDAEFKVVRTDLNGKALTGTGIYSVRKLEAPAETVLPADRPFRRTDQVPGAYDTPGDNQRPRWSQDEPYFRNLARWPENGETARGHLDHDSVGAAMASIKDLEPGPYRLVYKTRDQRGDEAEVTHEFIVVDPITNKLPFCLEILAESQKVSVGQTARFMVRSGLKGQRIHLNVFHGRKIIEERVMIAGKDQELVEIPITEDMRGGIQVKVHAIRDYQVFSSHQTILVPWDNQKLDLEIVQITDRLRCGDTETVRLKIKSVDGRPLKISNTELLGYMYDRSLDALARHHTPNPGRIFRRTTNAGNRVHNLSHRRHDLRGKWWKDHHFPHIPLVSPRLALWEYGYRERNGQLYAWSNSQNEIYDPASDSMIPMLQSFDVEGAEYMVEVKSAFSSPSLDSALMKSAGAVTPAREQFQETAFFHPHVQLDENGEAVIEFQVPQTATDWNLEFHAITTDLRHGRIKQTASSSKELLVRPYLPRFLREGDRAEVKVVLNNNTDKEMECLVDFSILGEDGEEDITGNFGLVEDRRQGVPVVVPAHGETDLMFPLKVPSGVGLPSLKVVGRGKNFSDGELRPLPILPSRMYLQRSQFVALDGVDERNIVFDQMNDPGDPTLLNEKLVVTIDAQLFQSALAALPYLVTYPYQCTEQTLNRFLCAGILGGLYAEYPEVAGLGEGLAQRETRFPAWQVDDPNRRILLEETPWLNEANGGAWSADRLVNLLDPVVVQEQMEQGLGKLRSLQDRSGGFPWFAGGKPSPYLTLYVLQGFARGQEFGLDLPDKMSRSAWGYMKEYFQAYFLDYMVEHDVGWNISTYLVSLMSSFPDQSWKKSFSPEDRDSLLDFSFRHWLKLSRMMKMHLSLALLRNDRAEDAGMVLDSVMDGAIEDEDLGIYWEPEDRSWLWDRDTIESHAMTLRVMCEVYPGDPRTSGLAKWLLLNRHLNQWKSTRATAEAIYALAYFMEQDGTLNSAQTVVVETCGRESKLEFLPTEFTGQDNHLVFSGDELDGDDCGRVVVRSETPGMVFASANWHFSTEELPICGEGDLLGLEREYFKLVAGDSGFGLETIEAGDVVAVGDLVEVHLRVRSEYPMEYILLRDPRAAGFEPVIAQSRQRSQSGLSFYEEIRDNGVNIFLDKLGDGEFLITYRLRANMGGEFRIGPAILQSVYAPEFSGYSGGQKVLVGW